MRGLCCFRAFSGPRTAWATLAGMSCPPRSARASLAALVALLALAACGDDDSSTAPDAGPGDPLTAFCTATAERICAGLESCGCRFDVRPYDATTCVAARAEACTAGLAGGPGLDVAAGRARVDQAALATCLADLDALGASCTLATGLGAPLPASCAHVIIASAAVGARCEVGGGLAFCGALGEGICAGEGSTCVALPANDQACLEGLCAPGLVCNGTRCAPPGVANASCAGPDACGAGLVCTPAGTCGAPLVADATCDVTAQCAAGLECREGRCAAAVALGAGCADPSVCGAERSCGRAPETRTCAAPDREGDTCMTDTCAADLQCSSAEMVCVALPGDGETCLDGFACAPGLTCQDGVGTCAPLPGLGETCAAGARFCQDGLGCRESDQTCQPGPGVGEPCFLNPPDYVCAEGLGCDFGTEGSTCQARGGVGTPCNTDRTCTAETYCELSTLACAARLADGADCEDGNECRAGSACVVLAGRAQCAPIPGADEPCMDTCDEDLACKGPGGQCVAAFCVIPG